MLLFTLFAIAPTFGQTLKTAPLDIARGAHGGTTLSFLHYSPDFEHEHDGEHCLTDALTQDWIERAGIEDEYNEQVRYQNELVN